MFAPIVKEGIGLHTGVNTKIVIETGPARSGVILDVDGIRFKVSGDSIVTPAVLATKLGHRGTSVSTVEHLFAALNAYGETDVLVTVHGPEIPILDGSALPFAEALEKNGAKQRPRFLSLQKRVEVSICNSVARVTPLDTADNPSITVKLDFDDSSVKKQDATYFPLTSKFIKELAPARTFAFESDVEKIHASGLGLGGSLDNALVIGPHGPLNQGGLRFHNEPARHKLLDALGDFLILGGLPWADVELTRPGHRLMHELVKRMKPLCEKQEGCYPRNAR